MNSRYLILNGKPWFPVMGEFHYSRVPEAEWEEEILKVKAAGVQIVATYVIWIHHEEVEGQFDWSGQRNLHKFVELCGRHGMYVVVRIGPWAHGEVRNGGFPDWLLQKTKNTRQIDPVYLSYVRAYYEQIDKQLNGLLWKDGGPIIGVQLENEYSMRGPGKGEAYILELKKMAISAGLDVPVYTVTGWDNAVVPKGATVAVFGGYPDAPWDASTDQLPAEEVYTFRFGSRVTGNMGAIGPQNGGSEGSSYGYPFMTAEMGGGVEGTYHRRPVIKPDDVAAMMPVMLGSGVNLYGTYMFQGGENPNGKLSTLQESQATGYPNDLPVKSYDFQAPLSEFGEEREALRKLKVFNYFLNDFGSQLAPMPPFQPEKLPSGPQDFAVERVSVRTDGTNGFLFFNNYVRYYPMPNRSNFQVRIKLPHSEVSMPDKPIDLPSGVYGIWPFGLTLGSLQLRYATAELFCRAIDGSTETYYFVATSGVATQFVFENAKEHSIESPGHQELREGATFVSDVKPSLEPAITAKGPNGQITRIVLLSQEQAENAWKLQTGDKYLLLTTDQFFENAGTVTLQTDRAPHFSFTIMPAMPAAPAANIALQQRSTPFSTTFGGSSASADPHLTVKELRPPSVVPAVKLGPPQPWRSKGVAMAPTDEDFSSAAKWHISIPDSDWTRVHDLFLEIDYDGDVARLTSGGHLLDDNFYDGEPWRVGLKRFRSEIAKDGLDLEILPRRADAPVFLEKPYRASQFTDGQVDRLRSVQVIPEYRISLEFTAAK